MAIIGKIREKSWLILVLVGGALLAFILGDWQKISGGLEDQYGLGLVYGEMVDRDAYQTAYNIADLNAERQAQQSRQPKQPVDEVAVWNSFVQDMVINQEMEALGIDVSQGEFDAYLYGEDGFPVMPDLAQNFIDSTTGQFSRPMLEARIEDMKSSDDPEIQKQWEESEKYYIDRRKKEKYFSILEQGTYVTKLEAKSEYTAQKEVKNISFVLRRFSEISNDDIKVDDAKLREYFEKNNVNKKYENRFSTRDVKYFDIKIVPSKKDSSEFNNMIEKIKSELASTKNDSTYVLKNSDLRFYTSGPYSTAVPEGHPNASQHLNYPAAMDTVFEKAQLGQIVGPYQHNGVYNIAKVIGFTRDTINARHILLPVPEGKESEVQARADSILKVINKDNFVEYVKKYSTDTGSAAKGGELGDFFFSQMVQPFATFCADKPIGEIGQVRSQFGIHIIEVLDRKGPNHPRLALIQKELKPSSETLENIEKEAYDMLYALDSKLSKISDQNERVDMFDTLAMDKNYFTRPVTIQENSPRLFGFNTTLAEDKILELAFNEDAKVGDLVNSPIKDKDRYVIAIVGSIKVKGEAKFEDVKQIVKNDYIQDQKAKRLMAQMMNAKSLDALTKNGKASVQKAEVVFANPQITGGGFEPEVVGALFSGLKDGQMTKPIQGKQGVYVVRIDKTMKAPAASNYDVERDQLLSTTKARVKSEATKALVEQADVIDNRRFYNIGIRR
ncbi:MAG: hypothetical protein EP333_06590 [Bacteroidetes bacterium]|nr:MAG: hypothetical protein EP333_06590 [Bacteroidota bacterium]